MKKLLLLSFIAFNLSVAFSQTIHPYNKAIIWRGFQHQWTYNHRCNRLGDYVGYNSGTPITVHTSATGIGADSAYFSSYYTYITTPDAVFKEGEASIRIQAKEKRLIEKTVTVTVPAEKWLRNKADYVTLLNGFDLRSDQGADKIQLLRFSIQDGEFISLTNEVRFKIDISMVLNCQSIECPEWKNAVVYDLDIHYLIIGINSGEAAATNQFITRSYSWDKKEELKQRPQERFLPGVVTPFFPVATVGIKSFSFVLNEAHWMVQINANITPVNYDSTRAKMKANVDMLFQEWEEGMKGSDAAPKQSRFSSKRKGWAVMDMDAVLLQLRQANIVYGENSGNMFWRGSMSGDKAKVIFDIPVD